MTCAHFDFKPEAAILASKQQFIANPASFDLSNATTILHALSLLNEIDDAVMEATRRSKLTSVGPAELNMTERRHICKLLISMKILSKKVCLEEFPLSVRHMISRF